MANEVVVFFLLKEENNQKVGKMESNERIWKPDDQTVPRQNKEGAPASSAATA